MKIVEVDQGSEEWKLARLEKISGTRLGMAIGTKATQQSLLNELIAEHLTGEPKDQVVNGAMARGSEAEDYAAQEYEALTGEITEQVGICVHDDYDWLVNSPDRLIKRNGKYEKAVEIKSPNSDTAVKYIRAGVIPKEYMGQVVSYFLVNEDLKELDFVVYDPRIKKEKFRLFIIPVKREELELEKSLSKVLEFRNKWECELSNYNLNF